MEKFSTQRHAGSLDATTLSRSCRGWNQADVSLGGVAGKYKGLGKMRVGIHGRVAKVLGDAPPPLFF